VPTGDIALWLRFPEWRQLGEKFLLPSPGQDCPKVFTSLIRRSAGIRTAVLGGLVMQPVQEITNVGSADLVDIDAVAPSSPLGDARFVFLAGSAREFLGSQVLC
jgi:hypothetical protein